MGERKRKVKNMSQRKTKSPENALFDGFSGIDTRFSHAKKCGSSDVRNFRIVDGGAMKKRYGFAHYAALDSNVRAVWTGMLNESEKCVMLCGSSVIMFDAGSSAPQTLGSVGTDSGKACFFYYRDRMYLADGKKIYELDLTYSRVIATIGYIPLIGKDWQTGTAGAIHEPRNLLCDKGRISYKIEAYPTVYLNTGWMAQRIDAVYLNGELVDPSNYSYNYKFHTVDLSGMKEGDEVLVYVTYYSPENINITNGLFTCTSAMNFGSVGGDRIFMWGGANKSTLYCSDFVSNDSMQDSLAANQASSPLYFPIGYEFSAGDGRHAVQAATRHYDRLLVFTESDAWNAEIGVNGLKDIPLSSINTGAGCSSGCAVGMAGNSPVSVGKHTIFAWNADTDEFNECNAKSISEAIDPLLPDSFYKNAIVFNAQKYGEIWFHEKGNESTWVYNIQKDLWYRFTGFDADGFFEFEGNIFFYDANNIFYFNEDHLFDIDENNTEHLIDSVFISHPLEFGTDSYKRLEALNIHADTDFAKISVNIDTDRTTPLEFFIMEKAKHSVVKRRLHSGRFNYATLTIGSSDNRSPKIYSAEIKAKG